MEKLYQELFNTFKNKSSVDYENHVELAKKQLEDKDFHFAYESFIPYPSYRNKNFNEIIYKKQEFHRNKSLWEGDQDYDETVADKCAGEFRFTPNQKFIKNFMSPLTPYRSLLIYHSVGVGKCHGINTPILMHDGTIKLVQNIKVNDKLMGDNSKPRTVLSLATGEDMMYDIIQSRGDTYRVNSEHILVLMDNYGHINEIEVKDYILLPEKIKSKLYGITTFVEFPEKETSIAPFLAAQDFNGIIPTEYLYNCVTNRFKYFMGLVDNFGSIDDETFIVNKVSDDLKYLGRSLGFYVNVNVQDRVSYFHKDTRSNIRVEPVKVGRYYGFVLDGNHRYLLGDFTITHNTCTAINIAEKYYDIHEKRVLVVLSSNIEENFKKQIYDINRVNQCTGTKYPDMILDKSLLDNETIEKKIDQIIKKRYEFVGYKELAIYMETRKRVIKEQIKDSNDPAKQHEIELKRKTMYEDIIRDRFSNRLIIIDEAHNLRLPTEKGDKQISTAFLELMNIIENVKLVLMTATPMYNTADEIVWMINLLLTNDRAPTIKHSDLFDKESKLTVKGEKILRGKTRGYVSYMRGENPFSFPFRLFPSINNANDKNILQKYPKKDIYGEVIPEESKVKFLEIITSTMSKYQYEVYNSFKTRIKREDEALAIADIGDVVDIDEAKDNNDVQNTMQVSNVVYPSTGEWRDNPRITYGLTGFNSCFDISNSKVFRIKYKEHVKEKFGEFLSYDNLDTYAPKIRTLIDYVVKSKGIVFIYSRYYGAGLFPLACALEHVGMSRYSIDGKTRNILENVTINDKFNGKKPKYCILSRKLELSPNNDLEIETAKSKANLNGEIIKVIIVSKIGTEGIDFKRIREVHIFEPWYNLNRAEQIIGRAVRTCSHIDLPKAERNVTIYFHANICEKDEESVDLRTYRISENKQKRIIDVETILRESSIDCNLNRETLLYPLDLLNIQFDIETAQRKIIKNYRLGDRDNSFICGFKACTFKCEPTLPSKIANIDLTTYDNEFISDDISLMKRYIGNLYKLDENPRTYGEILLDLRKNYKLIEDDIVNYALEEMVTLKYIIKLEKGDGYLLYRSNKYIFQYESLYDTMMSLEERENLKKKMSRHITLDLNKIKKTRAIAVAAHIDEEIDDNKKGKNRKEDEKLQLESIEMVYHDIYRKILLFFIEIDIIDKSYIDNIDKEDNDYEWIIQNIPDGVNIKHIITENMEKYNEFILDTILERLSIDELYYIYSVENKDNIIIKNLYEAMDRANIIVDEFILNPNDKKLYKMDKKNKIVECGPMDYARVNTKYSAIKSVIKDNISSGTKCYTRWQKNKLVFKVRESDVTLGAICDTSPKKDELVKRIEKYLGKKVGKLDYHKSKLCLILEVLSRQSKEFQRSIYLSSK
jgi:superfamily II DNA or RNA helicase